MRSGSKTKGYTCCCDSPCSGCRTCDIGCWAFCRESTRYCAKGCSDSLARIPRGILKTREKFHSVVLRMPTGSVADVLGRLFGVSLVSVKLRGGRIGVQLQDVDLKGILRALRTHSVSLKVSA